MAQLTLNRNWLQNYPEFLIKAFQRLGRVWPEIYVTGGAVRDWLQGRTANDLDLTMAGDAITAAREFASVTGGAFILLDEDEGVARVVCQGITIDFSTFREGANEIISDLMCRDFSINAMATPMDAHTGTLADPPIVIDPLDGALDLEKKLVRAPGPEVFEKDPLRILRAFRFASVNGFAIDEQTLTWLTARKQLVTRPAAERIRYELDLIISSATGGATFKEIHDAGLLELLFPVLRKGRGLEQPSSHHQDVLVHNLTVLEEMDKVIADPGRFFPEQNEILAAYIAEPDSCLALKWAALFHDCGKPDTCVLKDDSRITFYNHDQVGATIWSGIGRQFCWSSRFIARVALLIKYHMYPFHLNNSLHNTGITPRACLKLVKTAGDDMPGLFLLSMADSLAARGRKKPSGMEEDLAMLYSRVDREYHHSVKRVVEGPALVTGGDLIALGLEPGPLFSEILDEIEGARVSGEIKNRQDALDLVTSRYKSGE